MDPIDPPPIGARVRIGGGDGCGVLGTVSAIRVPLFSAWPTACLRVVVACDDGVTRDIRPWQALPVRHGKDDRETEGERWG